MSGSVASRFYHWDDINAISIYRVCTPTGARVFGKDREDEVGERFCHNVYFSNGSDKNQAAIAPYVLSSS